MDTTSYFDFDKPIVAEFAARAVAGASTDKEKAIKAFLRSFCGYGYG